MAFTTQKKRELLHGWLWAMYCRACQEDARARGLGLLEQSIHHQKQARIIAGLLAGMTAREHAVIR